MLCVCPSVSVSVWEGGDKWLREVTGKHGSKFLPFSGPSVGYWIFLLESLGNGRFGPNPSREVTGGHGSKFLPFGIWPIKFLLCDYWDMAGLGQSRSVGVRNKIVCKGMRSNTEEGGAKGCKARRSLPKVLQMFWVVFIRDCKRTFGVITRWWPLPRHFSAKTKKIRAKGWLSSPLLRWCFSKAILIIFDVI